MSATCQTTVYSGAGQTAGVGPCGRPATEAGPHGAWCSEHMPIGMPFPIKGHAEDYGPGLAVAIRERMARERAAREHESKTLHEQHEARIKHLEILAVMAGAAMRDSVTFDATLLDRVDRAEERIAMLVKANRLAKNEAATVCCSQGADQLPVKQEDAPPAHVAGQFASCSACGHKFANDADKLDHLGDGPPWCQAAGRACDGTVLTTGANNALVYGDARNLVLDERRGWLPAVATAARVFAGVAAAAGLVAIGSFAWQHAAVLRAAVGW